MNTSKPQKGPPVSPTAIQSGVVAQSIKPDTHRLQNIVMRIPFKIIACSSHEPNYPCHNIEPIANKSSQFGKESESQPENKPTSQNLGWRSKAILPTIAATTTATTSTTTQGEGSQLDSSASASSQSQSQSQFLLLDFGKPVSLQKIQILSHQSYIPALVHLTAYSLSPISTTIKTTSTDITQTNTPNTNDLPQLFKKNILNDDPIISPIIQSINTSDYKMETIGSIVFSDNSQTNYKARELNTATLSARKVRFLKLHIPSTHQNIHNIYKQVSLIAVNVIGQFEKVDSTSQQQHQYQLSRQQKSQQHQPDTYDQESNDRKHRENPILVAHRISQQTRAQISNQHQPQQQQQQQQHIITSTQPTTLTTHNNKTYLTPTRDAVYTHINTPSSSSSSSTSSSSSSHTPNIPSLPPHHAPGTPLYKLDPETLALSDPSLNT